MYASVVVPTYRRPKLLRQCLAALAAQEFEPAGYEVIVADDAAAPETRLQVEEFARTAPMRVVYAPVTRTHGPAAARNVGWRLAQGSIIAFTDDDCLPEPGWLAAGVKALERESAAAVSGRIVVPLPATPTDYELDVAGLEASEFVTANCVCRRDALEAIGGFDERFQAAWREDSDLQFALLAKGYRLIRSERAVVVHPVRPGRWGISLWLQWKGLYDALLYKKHPLFYRERIRPGTPWDYYGIVTALGGTAIAAATGSIAGIVIGLGAWSWLTGRFVSRRLRRTLRTPSHVAEMLLTSVLIPPTSVFWRLYGAIKYRVVFF